MANLISTAYFVGQITLPNSQKPEVTSSINWFIDKYEPECLRKILGGLLWKAYITSPDEPRMQLITDGSEYKYKNVTYFWDGLIQPTKKLSLIANYVYYYFMENSASQNAGVSNIIPKGEQAINFSPQDKMIDAYDYFCDEARALNYFLRANIADYPEVTLNELCYIERSLQKATFFGF